MEQPLAPAEARSAVDHLQLEFGNSSDMDELLSPSTASHSQEYALSVDGEDHSHLVLTSTSSELLSKTGENQKSVLLVSDGKSKKKRSDGGWEEDADSNSSFDSAMDVIGEEFGIDSDFEVEDDDDDDEDDNDEHNTGKVEPPSLNKNDVDGEPPSLAPHDVDGEPPSLAPRSVEGEETKNTSSESVDAPPDDLPAAPSNEEAKDEHTETNVTISSKPAPVEIPDLKKHLESDERPAAETQVTPKSVVTSIISEIGSQDEISVYEDAVCESTKSMAASFHFSEVSSELGQQFGSPRSTNGPLESINDDDSAKEIKTSDSSVSEEPNRIMRVDDEVKGHSIEYAVSDLKIGEQPNESIDQTVSTSVKSTDHSVSIGEVPQMTSTEKEIEEGPLDEVARHDRSHIPATSVLDDSSNPEEKTALENDGVAEAANDASGIRTVRENLEVNKTDHESVPSDPEQNMEKPKASIGEESEVEGMKAKKDLPVAFEGGDEDCVTTSPPVEETRPADEGKTPMSTCNETTYDSTGRLGMRTGDETNEISENSSDPVIYVAKGGEDKSSAPIDISTADREGKTFAPVGDAGAKAIAFATGEAKKGLGRSWTSPGSAPKKGGVNISEPPRMRVEVEKEKSACEPAEAAPRTPNRSFSAFSVPMSFSPPTRSMPQSDHKRNSPLSPPSTNRTPTNPPRSPYSAASSGYHRAFPVAPPASSTASPTTTHSNPRRIPRSSSSSDIKKDSKVSDSGHTHSKKVRFRQRYPVPPLIVKPRPGEEIVNDNIHGPIENNLSLAQPKRDLRQLLDAATGDSIARRSNACGALKVLTAQTKNQLVLVRTSGFLDALIYAANQEIMDEESETALDARTRAVVSLLNVSTPKDNRAIVLMHPGLPDCLVKCIAEDIGEARAAACGAVAMLAKSASCRETLVEVQYLIDVLAEIMIGKEEDESVDGESEAKNNVADDEGSRSRRLGRTFSSSSDGSNSTNNSETSHIITKASKALENIPSIDSIRVRKQKQEDETKRRSRVNSCAALLHLSKHCSISQKLCQNETLLDSLIAVAREFDNPIHTKCLEIICNLTRFPWNNSYLAKYPGLVDILVVGGRAKLDLDRVWSMRAFQNLSADAAGKTVLANSVVLELLSTCVMRKLYDEQVAATAALYNLSTEPGAVVPLTNTKNVVATLVHVAHDPSSAGDVRLMACDSLATLGLWLQTLAGAGTVPAEVQQVPLPSYATTGWRRWDL